MKKQLSKQFDLSLYTVSAKAEALKITEQFEPHIEVVDKLKYTHDKIVCAILDLPNLTGQLFCNSAYRCERANKAVGGAKNSQHMTGEAMDLEYFEQGKECNMKLYDEIIKSGIEYDQIICEKGSSTNPAWIHVSLKKMDNRNQKLIIT
jgi:hypothetical protein